MDDKARIGKIATCVAGGLALAATLLAQDAPKAASPLPGNPYLPAATRNLFGLASPTPVNPDPQKFLPKIIVTGVYSVFGRARVLVKISGGGGPDRLCNLGEGQDEDDVTVECIGGQKGIVTFKNHGFEQEVALPGATDGGGEKNRDRSR